MQPRVLEAPVPGGVVRHLGRRRIDLFGNVELEVWHLARARSARGVVLCVVSGRAPLAREVVEALLGHGEELEVVALVPEQHRERPERVLVSLARVPHDVHARAQDALCLLVQLARLQLGALRLGAQVVCQGGGGHVVHVDVVGLARRTQRRLWLLERSQRVGHVVPRHVGVWAVRRGALPLLDGLPVHPLHGQRVPPLQVLDGALVARVKVLLRREARRRPPAAPQRREAAHQQRGGDRASPPRAHRRRETLVLLQFAWPRTLLAWVRLSALRLGATPPPPPLHQSRA